MAIPSPITTSDIRSAAMEALYKMAKSGKRYAVNDRTLERITFDEAKRMLELADELDNDASTDASGGLALVHYGERV